jgi:hypothetical protein
MIAYWKLSCSLKHHLRLMEAVEAGDVSGLTVVLGCAEPSVMTHIWRAAHDGDLAEVERLVGLDPGLLDARYYDQGWTPLMFASREGHVGVARWLLDHGAAINERTDDGVTVLVLACRVR